MFGRGGGRTRRQDDGATKGGPCCQDTGKPDAALAPRPVFGVKLGLILVEPGGCAAGVLYEDAKLDEAGLFDFKGAAGPAAGVLGFGGEVWLLAKDFAVFCLFHGMHS